MMNFVGKIKTINFYLKSIYRKYFEVMLNEPNLFIQLFNFSLFLVIFLDVHNVTAFQVECDSTDDSLWLTFSSKLLQDNRKSGAYLRGMKSLIETFFIVEQENIFGESDDEPMKQSDEGNENIKQEESTSGVDIDSDDESDCDVLPTSIIDKFYQQLRESQEANNVRSNNYTNEYVQHKNLRPRLTQYQINGVKWMLNRERITSYYPTEFKEIKRRWIDDENHKFYYNQRTILIRFNQNEDVKIPCGGILADAMGLGKTVEMLDLILLNQRVPEPQSNINSLDSLLENIKKSPATQTENTDQMECDSDEPMIRCLCSDKKDKSVVNCVRCNSLQHRKCVSQIDSDVTPDKCYMCPYCWQKEQPIKAKTTFIVSPTSIKMQWYDEVVKHISCENFKVRSK